jgi:hypothetical protein
MNAHEAHLIDTALSAMMEKTAARALLSRLVSRAASKGKRIGSLLERERVLPGKHMKWMIPAGAGVGAVTGAATAEKGKGVRGALKGALGGALVAPGAFLGGRYLFTKGKKAWEGRKAMREAVVRAMRKTKVD